MGPLVVLAYSGGLDTSAIVPWLRERYGARVLCFAADVGQGTGELGGLVEKAKRSGAADCVIEDLREEFVRDFVFPTLRAGAVYARTYLLGTAMARPVMAAHQVALAQRCTGKGNDQVRFELTYAALGPDLQVIAPWREWEFQGREDLLAYVKAKDVPVQATAEQPYSTDRNLWHCSHEGGILEDPAREPPEHIFVMTKDPLDAPELPALVEIGFEEGTPVSVDHVPMGPVELVATLNAVAGEHGVGRADVVEDRLVGMKSRGVYETPGGTLLFAAHRELEQLVLDRRTLRLKDEVALRYADLVDARARGARRGDSEHPEARHGPGAAQAVQGERQRGRAGKPVRAVPAFVRDVRQGQCLQPAGRRGLHSSLRARNQDRGWALRGAPRAGRRRGGRLMTHHPTETPAPAPAPHQMWGGRFNVGPSEALDALNRSLPVDHRLWPQDVTASRAWVQALGRVGVLAPPEESALLEGLDRVAERLADGAAVGAPDEDVHTLVERLLYEEVGVVAGKLHTGRSRNDQVATDLRLWTLDAVDRLDADVAALGRTLVARAREGVDIILPGYTHGQRAQPVRWAYVLLAHAWPLGRDRQRLADARRRVAELPLGSGALAGSGFAVDRVLLKEALGFRSVSANALDATGDRDFVAEVLFALALVGTHLSRLAAEFVMYTSAEFGFVRLSDDFSTGSSLLPQKRNPDVFELARAKAGRLLGDLVAQASSNTSGLRFCG